MGLTDEMGFGTQVWHAKILELAIAQWTKILLPFLNENSESQFLPNLRPRNFS